MSNMRFIEPPQPNDRVVAAEIDGRLEAEDMEALVQRLQPIVDPLSPQQIKHFYPDKTDEAWAWLLASETSEDNAEQDPATQRQPTG